MGARGPTGLPNNVHAMRGTVPTADRNGEKTKPVTLRPVTPTPPDWLDAEAMAEWQRVVPALDDQGLLASVDRAVLANYCTACSVLVDAIAELAKLDSFVEEGTRGSVRVAQVVVWRDAAALQATLAGRVFCTPVDRLRTRLPEVPDAKAEGILD